MTLFNVEIDFDAKDYVSLSIDGENAHLLDESDIERALMAGSYQDRVAAWVETCFGESSDPQRKTRRAHRFAEEPLEFLQSVGIPKEHVLQLVDYVYERPAGDPVQELGGVMVTLCGAATAHDLDVNDCAEKELARVWTKVDSLRAKNDTQDKSSPFPGVTPIDPRTGRPLGDHGTALQAMQYSMIEHFCDIAPYVWLLFDSNWINTKQSSRLVREYCTDIVAVGRLIWIPGTKMSGKDDVSWFRFSKHKNHPTVFHGR